MNLAVVPSPEKAGPPPRSDERLLIKIRAVQKAFQLLDRVCAERTIGIAIANPGVGKSYILKAWRRKNQPRVRHIWIEAAIVLSPGPVLDALVKALGIECDHKRMWKKLDAIAEAMARDPVLVVIDEADLLTVRGFEVLRSIWDRCAEILDTDGEAAFPLALFGTRALRVKLAHPDLERLQRRISEITELDPMDEGEMQMALKSKWPGLRYDDDGFAVLHRLSRGSFGWLNKIVPIAAKLAAKDGGMVTARIAGASRKYLLGLPEE